MPIDNRTTGRNYPLPHPSNLLAEDVQRLRDALNAIDADVTQLDQLIDDVINGAPEALNTLNELAAALNDDANFAATVTNALNNRYTKAESDARYVQGVTQTENVFTGNGSQATFTLSQTPPTRESLLVTVDGVVQPVSEYNLSGTSLTLSEAPASGAKIRVLMLGVAGPVQSASTLSFTQAGTGAVTRTVDSKLKDAVSVKDFGAVGNGVADDTAAIQAAVDSGKSLYFPEGTYIVSSTVNATNLNRVVLYGRAIIKAKDSTDFNYLINFTGTSDVTVEGLTFDANKSGRSSAAGILSTITVNATTRCSLLNCIFQNSLGTANSSVAVAASGDCVGLRVIGCSFLDCGTTALSKPSDGIFVRGSYCVVDSCYAKNVTDTAFVLEGCNYCTVSNCTAENVTALAGVTNDTNTDANGNQLSNLTCTVNYVGSTGGVIALAAFGDGNVRGTQISNVSVRLADGATGLGPLVQIRKVGNGKVIGASLDGISLDSGATSGKVGQGFLIQNCDDIQVLNSNVRLDTAAGTTAYLATGDSSAINIIGGFVRGSYWGLRTTNTSQARVVTTSFQSQAYTAIYAADSSIIREYANRITSPGNSEIGSDAAARMLSQHWQSWTPVFSTDVGNGATSFAATPTVSLARITRNVNTVTVTLRYNGIFNAITASQIRISLPVWCSVANNATYSPASVLNNGVWETGVVRPLSGTDVLIVYRNGFANYTSAATFEGQFSFTFEVNS